MKKIVALSTLVLAACVVAPLVGQAAQPAQKTNTPNSKSGAAVRTSAADPDRVIYVVMRTHTTGSMIPTVYRIYRGRVTTAVSQDSATYTDLAPAGSESVAGSLTHLDPSITTTLHH